MLTYLGIIACIIVYVVVTRAICSFIVGFYLERELSEDDFLYMFPPVLELLVLISPVAILVSAALVLLYLTLSNVAKIFKKVNRSAVKIKNETNIKSISKDTGGELAIVNSENYNGALSIQEDK